MSDKVVDRVMRRRGSRGLGWLKQPPTVEVWDNTESAFRYDSVVGGDRWLRRAISPFLVKSDHWTLRIRHLYNIMNSELMMFGMRLTFILWQHSVSWQAQNIVQFIPLNAVTNTSTALDGTLASTCFGEMHAVLRCRFGIHWEMLWLQCFPCSRHQLLPPLSSASQNYSLRHRTHQFSLPDHTGRLMDCNFLIRSLFKDVY